MLSFTIPSDPHNRFVKISATIITLNEERNIARAIESLRCADEIVVVDSGSTDRTVEIAEKLGARVIESAWPGYANQKNRAAEQASHDWILSIDADESLSEALEAEVWQLKKSGPQFDAYTMPRLAQYLGRWIRHSGWYPDRKVRLYHRGKATWEGAYVHESVKVRGRTRPPGVQSAPLYVQLAFRTSADHGPLHDSGRGTVAGHRRKGHLAAHHSGAAVDVLSDLFPEAGFSGRAGGACDRQHGGHSTIT